MSQVDESFETVRAVCRHCGVLSFLLLVACGPPEPAARDGSEESQPPTPVTPTSLTSEQCRVSWERIQLQRSVSALSADQRAQFGIQTLGERIEAASREASGDGVVLLDLPTVDQPSPDLGEAGVPVAANFDAWGEPIRFLVVSDSLVPTSAGQDQRFGTSDDLFCSGQTR